MDKLLAENIIQADVSEEEQLSESEERVPFELTKRRAVIVYVYSLKQLKSLRRFGQVMYVSRRMKYVVIYMNGENVEEAKTKLSKLHFVRNVIPSFRPDVEMNFAEKVGKKADFLRPVEEEGFDVEELNTTIKLKEASEELEAL